MLNKNGYKSFLNANNLKTISISEIKLMIDRKDNIIDSREAYDFSTIHIKNSINIPLNGRYAITAANILDVKKKLVVICNKDEENESIVRLKRVGFENIIGVFNSNLNQIELKPLTSSLNSESSKNAHNIKDHKFIDVRTKSEFNLKHVKSSVNIPLFDLEDNISKINKNENYFIYCRSGYRSSVATSILKKNKINNLINIKEGMNGLINNKNIIFE